MFDLFINQVTKYGPKLVSQKQAKFFAYRLRELAEIYPLEKRVFDDKHEKSIKVDFWLTDEDRKTNPNWITIRVSWGGIDGLDLDVHVSEAMTPKMGLDWQGGRLVKTV